MKAFIQIPIEQLREAFEYDPETGILRWKKSGKPCAPSSSSRGYLCVKYRGQTLRQSRVISASVTGAWPEGEINHLNGVKSDNRFANLREATHAECAMNQKMKSRNQSGLKGTCKHRGRWQARIRKDGKDLHLGSFATPEQAHAAYRLAADRHYGAFARYA